MAGDSWRPWRKVSPEHLARYVNHKAAERAVEEAAAQNQGGTGFFRLMGESGEFRSIHDLREHRQMLDVLRALYDGLCRLDIEYDLEPVSTDDPADVNQKIRPPVDVVAPKRGKGTCLDLALLFSGLCIGVRLLPLLVLLKSNNGLHALVVVDGTYDDRSKPRGWREEDRRRGWRDGKRAGEELTQRINEGSRVCVAVECTGFAKTSVGRDHPVLTFEKACAEGSRRLAEQDHVITLDIIRLQQVKDYAPYELPLGPVGIDAHTNADLAKYVYDFSSYLAPEKDDFVGRRWVMEELAEFCQKSASGYFCVVAEAGLGKTALAAKIARCHEAPAFFFSISEGRTRLDQCLRHLGGDLITRFTLPHEGLPDRAGRDWNFVGQLVGKATKTTIVPLLMVIDAVDEAETIIGSNALLLPSRLPQGLHVVLTSRTDVVLDALGETRTRTLRLTAEDERHREDVRDFIRAHLSRPELSGLLPEDERSPRDVVQQLADASGGNLMYLHYVFADLASQEGGAATLRLTAIPAGLDGYYEKFWLGIEAVRGTDGWNEWRDLFSPTIALLGVALEPVSAEWISQLIGRPAEEVEERALKRWERFLYRDRKHGRWRIIHKSFADFMAKRHRAGLRGAHDRIVANNLEVWGGLEKGLPKLSAATIEEETAGYGWRHVVEHLRERGDVVRLAALVEHPRWYEARMAFDSSGQTYQADLAQLRAAVEAANTAQVERGRRPGIEKEIDCALGIASINSLSRNMSVELLVALVKSGHWSPKIAVAAIGLNPSGGDRERSLNKLAPYLDDNSITDALKIVYRGLVPWHALGALLRRRCELGFAQRAFVEASSLPDEDGQAIVLGNLADRLPTDLWRQAITRISELIGKQLELWSQNEAAQGRKPLLTFQPSNAESQRVLALAGLFRHAPESMLDEAWSVGSSLAPKEYRCEVLEALILRRAELGQWQSARVWVDEISFQDYGASVLAKLVCHVPSGLQARQQIADDALTRSRRAHRSGRPDEKIVAAVLDAFDAAGQLRLLREVLPTSKEAVHIWALKTLIPVLPQPLIAELSVLVSQLPPDDRAALSPKIASRLAGLGQIDESVAVARNAGDSHQVGEALAELLPRLAALGFEERAVTEALVLGQRGREYQVPGALAAVSRHVSGTLLDQLRDRARKVPEADDRRRALVGIAQRYAVLGQPEEGLRLARLIDDEDARMELWARVAVSWNTELKDCERALGEALSMPFCIAQLEALEALATDLSEPQVWHALGRIKEKSECRPRDDRFPEHSWMDVLAALLSRLVRLGRLDEAWHEAAAAVKGETGYFHYSMLAKVAGVLPEVERETQLQRVLNDIVTRLSDWDGVDALTALVPVLTLPLLRTAVQEVDRLRVDRLNNRKLLSMSEEYFLSFAAQRFAALGLPLEGWNLAVDSLQSYFLCETIGEMASRFDEPLVRHALEQLWSEDDQVKVIPPLLRRLAALGFAGEVLGQLSEIRNSKVKLAAIVQVAPGLSVDTLQRLERSLADMKHSASEADFHAYEYDEALAAIARGYAMLNLPGDAMRVARSVSRLHLEEKALAGVATCLEGALLDEAIALSSRIYGDAALTALLPRLAEQDSNGARRAIHIACEILNKETRRTALAAIVWTVAPTASVADLYDLWTTALHFLSMRERHELLADCGALLPVAVRLGGAATLEGTMAALHSVTARWP